MCVYTGITEVGEGCAPLEQQEPSQCRSWLSRFFFVPLVSIVIGAVFLDERPTLSLLIGAALIVTGIYTVNRSPTGKDKYVD